MAQVDARSPETAYCSKSNIVLPAAGATTAVVEARAAFVATQNVPPQGSTYVQSGTDVTKTQKSSGRG